MASYLEAHGFKTDVLDYQLNTFKDQYDPQSLACFLLTSARILGISTFSNALPYLIPALAEIKRRDPDKIIILGGSGVSEIATQLLERFAAIDYIITGEGESAFLALLQNLKRGIRTPPGGVIARRDGKILIGKNPPALLDIDTLPLPAMHKVPLDEYDKFYLVTMRGCPFACSFCYVNNHWTANVRYMSVERIFDHIHLLLRYTDKISFADDLFPGNRKRFLDFCAAYKKGGYDFEWTFSTRVNTLAEDMMRAASACNASRLFIGVESASDNVLKGIHKQYPSSIIRKQLFLMKKHFNEMHVSLIYGFPFETLDDFRQTLELARWCVAHGMEYRLHKISPLPGTPMTMAYQNSIVYDDEFSDMVEGAKISKPIAKLILDNKDIFSAYFGFKSPQLEEKKRLIDEFENTPLHIIEKQYKATPLATTS